MKTLRISLISIVILMGIGCCATEDIIRKDYVDSDRATYESIGPKYLEYVRIDPRLDAGDKKRRARTITTWRLRLEQAEKSSSEGE